MFLDLGEATYGFAEFTWILMGMDKNKYCNTYPETDYENYCPELKNVLEQNFNSGLDTDYFWDELPREVNKNTKFYEDRGKLWLHLNEIVSSRNDERTTVNE